jgi:UDP-N-acetylbacillosamine N-acetyltransferase
MNNNLLIIGAGGHGIVVKETAEAVNGFGKIDFLDDKAGIAIGKCEDYKKFKQAYKYAFVALGNNELRAKWFKLLAVEGFILPVIVHPAAYVSPSAVVEDGTFISAKAAINTNTAIGKGCIISIGALVDHDCAIGEFSHINIGAVIKSGCKFGRFKDLDAGEVFSGGE